MKGKILVVDDEKNQRILVADFLKELGHEIVTAENGEQACELIEKQAFNLVISDYKMKNIDGIAVLRAVKEHNPSIGVILISAFGTVETAVEAMKAGADDFLVKPINLEQLSTYIQKSLAHHALVRENRELKTRLAERFRLDNIIGESGTMQEVINLAGRAAASTATILIRGESGTGKGLLAQAIHYASDRAQAPFLEINCAALSPGLLESELFGHEKGAFTGADRLHQGKFEMAHRGTLFLDEVGDLPPDVQIKLLNVIQSKSLMRVGGNTKIQTDVRLVAATHRDLEQMIKDRTFREDLYFRLNVVALLIPPLRERKSDIPLLIDHLLHKHAHQNKKYIQGLTREALDLLITYDYPGNVRELENAIMRAVVLARDTVITPADLPPTLHALEDRTETIEPTPGKQTLTERVERLEKQLISQALRQNRGIQTQAALMLGINERNLRYKMRKYGLSAEMFKD
ncbi:sigma-54-dependent Fis family transcriptional regulator [bacterium]|nr:sigma-54-dependent Fis family transcriptional regulator [bacterium]